METFILVKPDAAKNKVILEDIYENISNSNLNVKKVLFCMLTSEDIDFLWPQTKKSDVLNGLLKCYLMSDYVHVIYLTGVNCVMKVKKIKKEIREKYGICKFQNCIHTPTDANENLMQLKYISNIDIAQTQLENSINQVSQNIWNIIQKKRWGYNVIRDIDLFTLNLINDEINTIDYVAHVLSEELPSCTIEEAYIIVLEIEMYTNIPIYTSKSIDEVKYYANRLKQANLTVSINRNEAMLD